jgi:hypothetical protein
MNFFIWRIIIFVIATLLSFSTYAANVDISNQVKVISTKLVKISGVYTTTVTIKNTSKNQILSPILLSFKQILPSTAVLLGVGENNATSIPTDVPLLFSNSPLAAGKSISQKLYFSDSSNSTKFSSQFKLDATAFNGVNPQLVSVSSDSITSGKQVVLHGSDFYRGMKVMLDKLPTVTTYVSSTELNFVVPFTVKNKQLFALPSKKYKVNLGGDSSLSLQVNDLPKNTDAPGVVFNDYVTKSQQKLQQSITDYQQSLPLMLKNTAGGKSAQDILNTISDTMTQLQKQVDSNVKNIGKIDSNTLDILDRALLSNVPQDITVSSSKKSVVGGQQLNGDQWLANRQANSAVAESSVYGKTSTAINNSCIAASSAMSVLGVAGAVVAPEVVLSVKGICVALQATSSIAGVVTDVSIASKYGFVKQLNLNVNGLDKSTDTYSEGDFLSSEHYSISVNNFDNNIDNPTAKAKSLTGGSIIVSNGVPLASISHKLIGLVSKLTTWSAKDPIMDKIISKLENKVAGYIADKVDDGASTKKSYDISMDSITLDTSNCQTFFNVDGKISVPDSSTQTWSYLGCNFVINPVLTSSSEKDLKSKVELRFELYPKLTIATGGKLVSYSQISASNNSSCTKDVCTEYFSKDAGSLLTQITLQTTDSVTWSGQGTDSCGQYKSCTVTLDATNQIPPNVRIGQIPPNVRIGGTGYIKIANDGSELPDSAKLGTKPKDWACTKDNKTSLIWELKTNDGGLRDKNNVYTNFDAIYPKCDGTNCEKYFPSKLGASTNTDGFVKAVNAQGLCGSSNWRLPTKDELLTISPAGHGTGYFEDTIHWNWYSRYWISWSSSPNAVYAWYVGFGDGGSGYNVKGSSFYVRLVR